MTQEDGGDPRSEPKPAPDAGAKTCDRARPPDVILPQVLTSIHPLNNTSRTPTITRPRRADDLLPDYLLENVASLSRRHDSSPRRSPLLESPGRPRGRGLP